MLKDTKSLGNNKAPACESRGFVRKKRRCVKKHTFFFLSIFTPYKMFAGYLHLGIKRTEIPRNGDFAIDPNVVPLYKI